MGDALTWSVRRHSRSLHTGVGIHLPARPNAVTCQVVNGQGDVATGTFIVTVNPPSDTTSVLVPSNGAVLAGAPYLDAAAASPVGVTNVVFELSGDGLTDQVIGTATPTLFGWVAKWNTTSVANGTYTLQSVATDADDNTIPVPPSPSR